MLYFLLFVVAEPVFVPEVVGFVVPDNLYCYENFGFDHFYSFYSDDHFGNLRNEQPQNSNDRILVVPAWPFRCFNVYNLDNSKT